LATDRTGAANHDNLRHKVISSPSATSQNTKTLSVDHRRSEIANGELERAGRSLFELAAAYEVVSSNALQKSVNGKGVSVSRPGGFVSFFRMGVRL
jgi:hypothetical protein